MRRLARQSPSVYPACMSSRPTPWNESDGPFAVGLDLDMPGWSGKAPPLAIEYAGAGQDEDELARKIGELHGLGTRAIWVVRLTGPLRVEIHEPGVAVRLVDADGTLTAPGILANEVPVRALIDPASTPSAKKAAWKAASKPAARPASSSAPSSPRVAGPCRPPSTHASPPAPTSRSCSVGWSSSAAPPTSRLPSVNAPAPSANPRSAPRARSAAPAPARRTPPHRSRAASAPGPPAPAARTARSPPGSP